MNAACAIADGQVMQFPTSFAETPFGLRRKP